MLKAVDRDLGLITALAACLKDDRQEAKGRHEIDELLTQRIISIACGYEDANMKQSSQWLYEEVYCQRGDIEKCIKELHYGMEIGRTSCTSFWANQLRVLMTAAAYVLMQELRSGLAGITSARAQVSILRESF